ncbi:MAG: sigma-70 family RNA polymerase sigma factor [Phycisphaerales bacterium]|jgi:RNA polymerase sigma factor for flagellar operon FliA
MNAAERLILEHQSFLRALVRNIASTLPHHVDYDELVAFGQVGLTEAARSYEPGRGVLFTTFAHYRIRGAVFDGLRKMTWLPPAARRCVREQSAADEVLRDAEESAGAPASGPVLAGRFASAVERLGAVFLISGLGEGDGHLNPPDRRAAATDAEAKEMHARLLRAMQRLPEDMSSLLRMLYIENRSMSDVGVALGRNKSTVCRRHAEAIDLLRTMIEPSPPSKTTPKAAGRSIRREQT